MSEVFERDGKRSRAASKRRGVRGFSIPLLSAGGIPMQAVTNRPPGCGDARPARPFVGEGTDGLALVSELLKGAVAAIEHEPNRMGAWRMIGYLLGARRALLTHIALCNSLHGPLTQRASHDDGLDLAARALLGDHRGLVSRLDELISVVNRDSARPQALQESAIAWAREFCVYKDHYCLLLTKGLQMPLKNVAPGPRSNADIETLVS